MFDLGGGELLVILIFVLIFFGPKKLPSLAQSMGKGLREFKRAQREFSQQLNTAYAEDERKKNAAETQARRPADSVARSSSTAAPTQKPANGTEPTPDSSPNDPTKAQDDTRAT